MVESVRLDKWLWAVRIFKTRSDAAEGCRINRVSVNGSFAKPSREVKIGDEISIRKGAILFSYRVVALVSNRQPAKTVAEYAENITSQAELDKLNAPRETIFISRDRGTGRPTKKERRDIDDLMEDFGFDEELYMDYDDE